MGTLYDRISRIWQAIKKVALWLFAAIGIIGTILGFLAIFDYGPKLVVSVQDTLDPKMPFSTFFKIENQSKFAITNVSYVLYVDSLHLEGNKVHNVRYVGFTFDANYYPLAKIAAGDSKTEQFPFDRILNFRETVNPIQYADMTFLVKYKYLGVSQYTQRRFLGMVDVDKRFVWIEQPAPEEKIIPGVTFRANGPINRPY